MQLMILVLLKQLHSWHAHLLENKRQLSTQVLVIPFESIIDQGLVSQLWLVPSPRCLQVGLFTILSWKGICCSVLVVTRRWW